MPAQRPSKKTTLAGIVGVLVAVALGVSIPSDESGRKVEATVAPSGELQVRHITGRQYLRVYLDIVGVATACDGLTRDAEGRPLHAGQFFTEDECAHMLEAALIAHAQGVMRCSPGLALSSDPAVERVRQGPRFAAVSLAYNVGVGNYCSSSARRNFNAGSYNAGCEALLMWNRAGGRIVTGLDNRRHRERRVCLSGL